MRPFAVRSLWVLLIPFLAPAASAETLLRPAETIPLEPPPGLLAVGDFTGDGRDDVALGAIGGTCSSPADCRLLLLPQTPSGTLTGPFGLPTWPARGLAIGDFNGDGRGDIAFSDGGELSIYRQDAAGTLLPPVTMSPTYGVASLSTGDLNADGRLDLASGSLGGYVVDLFLQTPAGGLRQQSIDLIEVGGTPVVTDLDGDGLDDLLLHAAGYPRLTFLYQRQSGGLSAPVQFPLGEGISAEHVAVGSFDGDPLPEIVIAGRTTPPVSTPSGSSTRRHRDHGPRALPSTRPTPRP